MSARDFASDDGKSRIADAVGRAEEKTCAEVVVAIRRHASAYHSTSLLFAGGATVVALFVWWFSPVAYDPRYLPLELAVAFALAFYLAWSIDPLRRLLTPVSLRRHALERAARDSFEELGVRATRERIGILVYAGLFEREVRLVPDEGIDLGPVREAVDETTRALERALETQDVGAFAAAIESLGSALEPRYPCRHDDENELCNSLR